LASFIVDQALRRPSGRKIIMRQTWIEGHWRVTTTDPIAEPGSISTLGIQADPNAEPDTISTLGITTVSYLGDNLSVNTYRKPNDEKPGFTSKSTVVTFRSSDLSYSIHFDVYVSGVKKTDGLAWGSLFNNDTLHPPMRFEGRMILFSEGK
jgi:hypothetical protein